MTRIIMRTLYAGPDGTIQPGEQADLPEKTAADLVKGKYAEYAAKVEQKARDKKARAAENSPNDENEMSDPGTETADARPDFKGKLA